MKNPFEKQYNGALIGAVAAGAALAGGIAWLLLTDKGKETLASLGKAAKEKGEDLLAGFVSDKTGISKDLTKPAAEAVID